MAPKNKVEKIDASQETDENAIVSVQLPEVVYSVTDSKLAELTDKYKDVPDAKTPEGMEEIKEALRELVPLRTGIEKARVSLKSESLEYGRKVDAEAKRITSALVTIEKPLADAKQAVKDEEERLAEEAREAEFRRTEAIEARVSHIRTMGEGMTGMKAEHLKMVVEDIEAIEIKDELYEEYADNARVLRADVLAKVSEMYNERLEFEKQQAEQEAERNRQAERQAEMDEQQRKLDEQAEAQRLEKEEEQRRLDEQREAQEKTQREHDERVAREEQERLQREEDERLERERQEKEKQEREEAEERDRLAEEQRKKEEKQVRDLAKLREPETKLIRGYAQSVHSVIDDVGEPEIIDPLLRKVFDEFRGQLDEVFTRLEEKLSTD